MAIIRSRYFVAPIFSMAIVALPAWGQAASASRGSAVQAARSSYSDDGQVGYDVRRGGYDYGYREGLRAGENDARRGERFGYEDEREFRSGDGGYHRSYGDRDRYRQTFRSGYAAGYSEAYRRLSDNRSNDRYGRRDNTRYGGYGDPRYGGRDPRSGGYGNGGYGYYSPAFDNGSRDGYEKGQEDARKNRSFDPLRHSWYRSGDRRYERQYGSRDEYKNVYRRGFQQGYERGFQEGRYRW